MNRDSLANPPARPLARRLLLAASACCLAGRHAAGAVAVERMRLAPDQPQPALVVAEPPDADAFRLWIAGIDDPIELPASRARLLATLPIAGREVLAVTFAADVPGVMQDLVALIGWDGTRVRILGVETSTWRRDDGASFRMRVIATPDRQHFQLACVATMARPITRPFHLVWNDMLGWRDQAPLADASPRPPLPGGWQADLAGVRSRMAMLLAEPRTTLTLDDLAGTGMLQQFGCMAGR